MFPKKDRPGRVIWHDILPVVALASAILYTFWTRQNSDLPSNSLPLHWSIDHPAVSYQREETDIPKHLQWRTVWPTVVRFDRPVI
jgi:hypothetical protein